MDFQTWEPYYLQICEQFGYKVQDDREAAQILLEAMERCLGGEIGERLGLIETFLSQASVEIVGAALEPKAFRTAREAILIAADGATQGLKEVGVVPDIVVTDLDGPWEALAWAAEEGSQMVIHAHGDNRELLEKGVSELNPLLGTCQCAPPEGLHNFGGFTDGDRGVFLAASLGAKEIFLSGFDFDNLGQYSFHKDPLVKKEKLVWAKRLIEVAERHHEFRITKM